MRILIVNDDGIRSAGLISLARMAVKLGEVWVVAPESQCSAMSHRISVFGAVGVQPEPDFPVSGVKAYSISGSPADCVKVALAYIMKERPDVVFSGINNGYNVGIDILYSGTVGAAMEALVSGIPAIAFSNRTNEDQRVSDRYLLPVARDLLAREISAYEIWNVNFPSCDPEAVKGILYERVPAKKSYYETIYTPAGSGELPGELLPGAEDAAPGGQQAEEPGTEKALSEAAGTANQPEEDPRTESVRKELQEPGAKAAGQESGETPGAGEKSSVLEKQGEAAWHVDLRLSSIVATEAEAGSDMQAVFDGYISVGTVRNTLLMPQGKK